MHWRAGKKRNIQRLMRKKRKLIRRAEFGALGLPLMVLQEVQGKGAGQEETR